MQSGGISEEKRVLFTRQLRELRDSDAAQVVFSPSLTSDERKFVHKISQEFGLKSKSQGVDEKRFITVLKKKNNAQKASGLAPVLWSPHNFTIQALSDPAFATVARTILSPRANAKGPQKQSGGQGASSRSYDIPVEVYNEAQRKRSENKNYRSIQQKRNALPAAHYRTAVCNLLREHQIVLISGETGRLYTCGLMAIPTQSLTALEFVPW
jgi:HrpA-like RNA helicase